MAAHSMLRIALLVAMAATVSSSLAQQPRVPREIEIASTNLPWSCGEGPNVPKDAMRILRTRFKEDFENRGGQIVALIDLNGDGTKEILLGLGEWYSGGREYVVLQKQGREWRQIGAFQGGFVLSMDDSPNDYYRINAYYRSGDTYHDIHAFSKGRYGRLSRTLMPRAISYAPWWQLFWENLNGYRTSPCSPRAERGDPRQQNVF